MKKFSDFSVGFRIRSLGIAMTIAIIAVAALSLYTLNNQLRKDIGDKTQQLVQTAHSVISHYEAEANAGHLSLSDAKMLALRTLNSMRYDGEEYFFIIDHGPNMIMHPFKPELNGKDISTSKDPKGTFLFVEMVKVVEKAGEGFVPYMWPKPGAPADAPPVPKISYVKEFKPWGWIIGSGVYVDKADALVRAAAIEQLSLVLGVIVASALLGMAISRSVTKPLSALSSNMTDIAQGKLETEVEGLARGDELGSMARSLDGFREQSQKLKQTEQAARIADENARAQRKQAMLDMASKFETTVGQVVSDLIHVAEQLQVSAEGLVRVAEETKRKSSAVSQASSESSQATTAVASATDELSSSIQEISKQVQGSSRICNDAQSDAGELREHMNSLLEQANQVTQVTQFINGVADQINLLALNATIESARAGEAGRGFAVVAGEVKGLAGQTANASKNISTQMEGVHSASQVAHTSIERIVTIIGDINNSVTSIAAAVEEQSAATSEISYSVSKSATSVNEVRDNILDVERGADATNGSAQEILDSVAKLREQTGLMRSRVEEFLRTVRNAS